ncbi:MMPL family transporter [Spirillospora sp. NPDC047279]|uniref:MMPL family transporter n=1 Tax=Spirillospora sp. NPDC047279 TaxID=3155478 RepID=UPI00340035C7
MFARLGRGVVRHPWWTIVAWLVAAVAIVALSPSLETKSDQADFLPTSYESIKAAELAADAFPQKADAIALVVIKRTDGAALTADDQTKIGQVAQTLNAKKYDKVAGVGTTPEAVAPDKSLQIVNVAMKGTSQDDQVAMGETVKKMRKDLPGLLGGSLNAKVGGDVAAFTDNEKSFQQSFALVLGGTFILIIGLILLIFRAPIAAILPIVLIFATEFVSMGLIGAASKLLGFSGDDSLSIILSIVLFGIGADYYLFLLFRYRERLRAGDDKKTAMIVTVERVGEVITSAAAAIAATFLVLLLAAFGIFAAWGPSLAIAVVVMGITSLTLFPAVISLIGPAIFWPSKSWKRQPKGTTAARLGNLVGSRPALAAIVSGGILVALAAGAFSFKADYDFQSSFPQNTESAEAMQDMQKAFPPGLTKPVEVYLQSTDGQPVAKEKIAAFSQSAKTAPGVGGVNPAVASADGKVVRIDLLLKNNPVSNDSINLVKDDLRPAVHKLTPDGTRLLVGGETAIYGDINKVVNRDLSVILPVAGVLIAIILLLLLRSVVAPLYLVPAVLLGFAATMGAAVFVFQGLMGQPGEIFHLPIMLYLFVLAIGTDYNILMTARLREEAKEGHEPRKAAALAVEHGGPTVAAAGLILAGTFSVMLVAKVSMLQQMGFSIALGIALSAFVMSIFLVPGITALLGRKAWWPGHGDRPAKVVPPGETREDFAPSGHRS